MMPFMYEVICFDLDDTLFKEMDYLKSAYHEIAIYATNIAKGRGVDFVSEEKAYNVMLEAYRQEGNAFTALNESLGLEVACWSVNPILLYPGRWSHCQVRCSLFSVPLER